MLSAVRGGSGAEGAAFEPGEPPGRFLADRAEGDEFIAEVQHHAVVLEKAGDRAQARGGLLDAEFVGVRGQGFGERERSEGVESAVGHGGDIPGLFVDEEGVGVEDRADAGLVQAGDDAAVGIPAVGPLVAVEFEIAEAEETGAAAVVIDLGEPEVAGHGDPVIHRGLGERAEVEQVRAVVEGDFGSPGTGDAAEWHLGRVGEHLLERVEDAGHGHGDDGGGGADQSELDGGTKPAARSAGRGVDRRG